MPITGPDIIITEKKDHILTITLNRPERRNAMSFESFRMIREIEEDFAKDPDMRVAIYTGAGDQAFSAGMDLKDFAEKSAAAAAEGKDMTAELGGMLTIGYGGMSGIECWKPNIAAVNGRAHGGGCEMALSTDIRICADTAAFAVPEVKRGLIPGLAVILMCRCINPADALYLCMTGEEISAEEAFRIGLVSKVVPAAELMTTARGIAEVLKDNAPLAVQTVKKVVKAGGQMSQEHANMLNQPLLRMIMNSEDSLEGATAFAQKRKPNWKGK